MTIGKPATHPPTSTTCDGCHQTTNFRQIFRIDHTQATPRCGACHNEIIAPGKPKTHIPTSAPCELCHKATASFAVAAKMDHTGIVDGCATCHDGSRALGKPASHITTNLPCETCHLSTVTFAGATYTHQPADTNCSSCHNGRTARGMQSPPHIPTGTTQCSNCHSNVSGTFTAYTMSHSAVAGMRCDACHNGSFSGEGLLGALGSSSYPGHLATAGRDCTTCHASAAASFASWGGGKYTHQPADTTCTTCHNGTLATGLTIPPHIPVSGTQCSACHSQTATSFAGVYTMNHGAVSASRCDACHNGSYTGEGAKGAYATSSYPGHVATAGRDCGICHTSAASGGYVTFAGAVYSHAATDTNCSSCHNGTTATGLTTPPHIPVAGVQCSNCHTNTATSFKGAYTMNHSAVAGQRCDSCHSGYFLGEGAKGALGSVSYPGHVPTSGRDCATCHTSAASTFTSWAGAAYVHAAGDTNCSSCHNGTTATGMIVPPHIPIAGAQCSNCHTQGAASFKGVYTMTHAAVAGMRCDACHSGAYTGEGAKGALGTASYAGHVATAGRDCGTCHATAASGGYVSWAGAVYVHAATDTNCSSCHNGSTALGLVTPPHIPSGATQCGACHTQTATSFATYTMNHGAVSGMRCDACHNGSFTGEGVKGATGTSAYPGHLATAGRDCVTCHASSVSGGYITWAGGGYTHQAGDTACSTCHNGSTAAGLTTPPHVPVAGVQCSNCHSQSAPAFKGFYTMNHAAVAASRCDACHNGSYTGEGARGALGSSSYPGHVATGGRDCGTCHTGAASGGYATWAGAAYTHAPTDTNCSSCHNGTAATGNTTPPHIPVAGIQCSNCHVNTAPSFKGYASMNHAAVAASRCDACHNGSYTGEGFKGAYATSSYAGHVPTSGRDCGNCHTTAASGGFVTWAGAAFSHGPTDTNCSTCHNGTIATGNSTPPHIPAAGVQCSNCHVNTAPSFKGYYTMNHAAVAAARCDACHNGSYTGEGAKGALGTSAYANHVATAGRDCATCHTTAASSFVSWASATYLHQAADTACSSCHNGATATGLTTPPHIPVAGIQCSACHTQSATSFKGSYTMNHSVVSATRCDACHNGAYTAEGATGALGTGSYPGHLPTTGRDCATCHASAATTFTSWAGGRYVHQASDTACSSCHNGSVATGLTTPPHIPVTGVQCSNCHTQSAASFKGASTMSHAAVSGTRCDTCHNGSYTSEGGSGALGTSSYPGHVATAGRDCSTCHAGAAATFVSWAGGKYTHQASDTNCSSCHNGTLATGLTTPPHIPVGSVQCDACHTQTAATFKGVYTMTHSAVSASRCDACHNGSYTGEGAKGALGPSSYAGHVATAGRDCGTCHTGAASGGYVTWAGAVYTHAATDTNCSSCHNGTTATGSTTPPHIPAAGVQCSNCHTNTALSFKGAYTMNHAAMSASRCDACHNGSYTGEGAKGALGNASYPGHVATSGRDCATCHTTAASGGYTTWAGAVFTHGATDTNCSSCHNGTTATGLVTPPHVPVTGIQCSNCHVNTAPSFKGYYTMSHAAVAASRCDACHNGAYTGQGTKGALGTSSYPNHVATAGRDCATCHAAAAIGGYVSWASATYVHAASDTTCTNCHNGSTAQGLTTPPHIPTGVTQCSACHTQTAATFKGVYAMSHAAVAGMRCDACHNGSYTGEGSKGAQGTASYPGHIAPAGRDCATCHVTAASTFLSWAGGTYLHLATDTNCASCHNGSTAQGLATPPHIPTGALQCSNCHTQSASSFLTYAMNHAAVGSMRCDVCHSGAYTSEGAQGAQGTAAHPGHVATGGRDCVSCHAGAASTFVSWAGGIYTHLATDTACSSCHNGTAATGLTTPPHIPVTAIQCSSCHTQTAPAFKGYYSMTHSAVSAMRCDACHNGSFTSEGTKGAVGASAYPGHVATSGRDCATCHTTAASGGYVTWAGAVYTHAATDTNCSSCHNGTTATGLVTPPHVPAIGIQCSDCHVNTAPSFKGYYTMSHAAVAASRCDACHNGAYTSQGTKGALGTTSYAGHVVTSGRDCATCHTTAASGGYVSWAGAVFSHAATDTNCTSCHNGTTATGNSTPPHIPATGIQCSNCHVNSAPSFKGFYTMNHAAVAAVRCDACHNGSYTGEGTKGALGTSSYPGHVATAGRDCATCHTGAAGGAYVSWAGASYVHATGDTNCMACHNGLTALGMTTPPHAPVSGVQCSSCHTSSAASFTTYTMNHAAVSAMRCDACHNGSFAGEGAKGAMGTAAYVYHVKTSGQDCIACHASAAAGFTTWAGGVYAHQAGDTACATCHDGHIATGLTTPPHIPVGTVQCSSCHTQSAPSFVTYSMSHASVSGTRCDACHNGSYTSEGTKGALGTASYPGHVAPAGRDCSQCHANAAATFTSWAGGQYVHQAADTNCSSCHNGTTATGLTTPPHIPVAGVQCSSCHANSSPSFKGYATMTHSAVSASRCDACHNGAYTSEGTKGALGTASYTGHVATAGRDCMTCHASAASTFVSWAGGQYLHQAIDINCSSCHNNTTALGLTTPPHLPVAGVQCSSCHTQSARGFKGYYTMNHPAVATSRCDACHNGSYTGEGTKGAYGTTSYPGHVATAGRDCATCHTGAASGGYVTFAGAVYSHAVTDTNCSSCHNGTIATGNTTPPHIPVAGIQCSNCHVNTSPSFKGYYTMNHSVVAAMRCDACHNGSFTSQGSKGAYGTTTYPGHVATAGRDCATCHTTAASGGYVTFAGAVYAHAATDTNCSSCHNGTVATGLTNPPHVPVTGIQCSNCHVNTSPSFKGFYTMSHAAVAAARCDACHNGAYTSEGAKGAMSTASYSNHVATSGRDCATCHATSVTGGFVTWASGTFVHAAGDTTCTNCHNGVTALGLTTPPHVPTGATQCSNCHVNSSPAFKGYYTMNHGAVAGMRCDACHTGSYMSEGTKGAMGIASYPGHVAPAGRDCVSCHAGAASTFVSWAGGTYLHLATDTNCSTCHNGTTAQGLSTPPHVPTSAVQCSSCHTQTAPSFKGYYTMSHSSVSAMRCDACHNGAYTAEGASGAMGTSSYAGHVATSGRDCATCHANAAATFVSWSGGTYVHLATDTNCSTCHNGTNALGMTTPPHIPSAGVQCSNCHTQNAPNFTVYNMNHGSVAAMRCDACHNGSYLSEGAKGALGTTSYAGHVATAGRDCGNCHTTAASGGYVSWAGAVYTHQAADTNCSSCHNGVTATGWTTPPHIPVSGIQCSNCHTQTSPSFKGYATMSHSVVATARCDACHNGSYTGEGTKGAMGTASYGGHVATSGRDCITCHATAKSGGFVSWAGGTYAHLSTDTNCVSCHNGSSATGLTTPPHIPTGSIQCSNCHTSSAASFTTYTMSHAAVTSIRCDACHNGSYKKEGTMGAQSKPRDHPTTTIDCGCCHTSTTSWGSRKSPGTCTTTAKSLLPTRAAVPTTRSLTSGPVMTRPVVRGATPAAPVIRGATPVARGIAPAPVQGQPRLNGGLPPNVNVRSAAPNQQVMVRSGVGASRGAPFNHSNIAAPCATCHNGQDAIGKPARHVPTVAPCETCHKSTRTFGGALFDHSKATAACATCHNARTAAGKPKGHVETALACDACHKNTVSFSGAKFTHQGETAPCATCHNGVVALGRSPRHVPTTADCDTCHKTTTSFGAARFDHTTATQPCATCHDGVKAIGKPVRHQLTASACDDCHKSTVNFGFVRPSGVTRGRGRSLQ